MIRPTHKIGSTEISPKALGVFRDYFGRQINFAHWLKDEFGNRWAVAIILVLIAASLPVYAGEGGDQFPTRHSGNAESNIDASSAGLPSVDIDGLHPEGRQQAQAVNALRAYRDAYERHDVTNIANILAQDFELIYLFSGIYPVSGGSDWPNVFVQSREEFIAKRHNWKTSSTPLVELRMAVKTIKHWPDLGLTSITVVTTHKSRHFNPKFLEVYVFEERDGSPKLARLSMTLFHPASADDYEVGIYFVRPEPPIVDLRWSDIREDMFAMGPDAAFDKYVKMMSTSTPRVPRNRLIKFLIIFREPPPGGAKVVVRQKSYRGDDTNVFDVITVSRKGDPYFFITGRKWWGHNVGVNVEVTVDGVLVGEELLRIR